MLTRYMKLLAGNNTKREVVHHVWLMLTISNCQVVNRYSECGYIPYMHIDRLHQNGCIYAMDQKYP